MPKRTDDDHSGGSGWRFSWRIDRQQKLHALGRAFALTEESHPEDDDEREPDPRDQSPD